MSSVPAMSADDYANLPRRDKADLERLVVEAARNDPNVFAQYVFKVKNQPFHRYLHSIIDSKSRKNTWDAPVESGKALAVTTPIPTPNGWTVMANLRRGDAVFDRKGRPCSVTFATPIRYGRKCYRLTFDDGSTIDADADHLWLVLPVLQFDGENGTSAITSTADMLRRGVTFDVAAKRKNGEQYHQYRWRIPIASPVDFAPRLLPIHPYVLGAWLGDGDSAGPMLTFAIRDREIYDRCKELEGGTCDPRVIKGNPSVMRGNIGGSPSKRRPINDPLRLREKLKRLDLVQNKHIPAEYLTASIEQREELLAGLLDTDGSISGKNPRIELSFCNRRLAEESVELVRSLGFKATIRAGPAILHGRQVGERHRIAFKAYRGVFRLKRKLDRQVLGTPHGRTSYRCITGIDEIDSIPVRCIAVDSPDHTYLAGKSYTVTHNSTQVTIIRPTYDIGRNVHEMIALVSASPDLTRGALKVIRGHILENERLHRVFPHLKLVSKTKSSIEVERPRSTAKDPSMVAMGIEGAILGRRWTKLVTDDVLRFATTWTEHERAKTWARMQREMLPRLTKNATHTDIGTPWVGSDARHKLRRMPGYVFLRFDGWTGDVFDVNGRKVRTFEGGLWSAPTIDPVTGMEFGWTRARLEDARRSMAGHEFDRQVRCIALSQAMSIWGDHLEACKRLGQGIRMQEETAFDGKIKIAWRRPEPSWRTVFTGVDLAIRKAEASHDTAFFTGAVADRQKHVIELRRGKVEGPNIVRNMIDIVQRYPMHLGFLVESNQGQAYLQQFVDEPGILEALGASHEEADRIRIFSHHTGINKAADGIGVRSMNLDFERRRWPIPCDDDLGSCDLIQEWVDGLKAFDPVSHADDMVMASWLFWEQCRNFGQGSGDWEKFGIFVP